MGDGDVTGRRVATGRSRGAGEQARLARAGAVTQVATNAAGVHLAAVASADQLATIFHA